MDAPGGSHHWLFPLNGRGGGDRKSPLDLSPETPQQAAFPLPLAVPTRSTRAASLHL